MKNDRLVREVVAGLVLTILQVLWVSIGQFAVAQGPKPPDPPDVSSPYYPLQTIDGPREMPGIVSLLSENVDNSIMATGGPDGFGYTWNDSVPFSWIDATGGIHSGLTGDDGYLGPVDIGFNFKFYENTYSQLYFSTNGLVTFSRGAYDWYNEGIPNPALPNNFIAPFWDDLCVNYNDYNTGAIYYMQGGSAPNRYFVIEWHEVSRLNSTDLLTFEVILYENGDILMQYLSLSGYLASATVGIEDETGVDGLQYLYNASGLVSGKAIRFYRPAPSARVGVYPLYYDQFTHAGATVAFQISIRNTGDLGSDTYDLTAVSSWTVSLFTADGITPLTDTDGDGVADTGPLFQGETFTATVKVRIPTSANMGDYNVVNITVRSSRNTSKSETAYFRVAIPAPFAQAYHDNTDGAMSLYLARPRGSLVRKVTPEGYYYGYGGDVALAETPEGDFIYVWSKGGFLSDLFSALINPCGQLLHNITQLTDHTGATVSTYDINPAVAVAPNGRAGVIWYRYLWDGFSSHNYNVYFAILDPAGTVSFGPVNITNNAIWGPPGGLNVPQFDSPRIAATTDNRFILVWHKSHQESGGWVDDIWYAIRSSYGSEVVGPTKLTNDTPGSSGYYAPNLAQLSSAKAILTWVSRSEANDDIYYTVLSSNGTMVRPATDISVDETVVDWWNYDVAQLSDGRIMVAWEAWGCFPDEWTSRIRFAILDSSYNRVVAPTCLERHPVAVSGDSGVSVAADSSGHAVLTWTDRDNRNLYYALIGSDGNVLTPPMFFYSSQATESYVVTSYGGYGNTSFSHFDALACRNYLPVTLRAYRPPCDPYEPNDDRYTTPWGPLASAQSYQARLCAGDAEDNYYFDAPSAGIAALYLRLPSSLVSHTSIWLYAQSNLSTPICGTGPVRTEEYSRQCNLSQAGRYIVRLYTDGALDDLNDYTLRVTYP